jgi:hypothetical protein
VRQGSSLIDIKLGEEDELDGFFHDVRILPLMLLQPGRDLFPPSTGRCGCGVARIRARLRYPKCPILLRHHLILSRSLSLPLSCSLCLQSSMSMSRQDKGTLQQSRVDLVVHQGPGGQDHVDGRIRHDRHFRLQGQCRDGCRHPAMGWRGGLSSSRWDEAEWFTKCLSLNGLLCCERERDGMR